MFKSIKRIALVAIAAVASIAVVSPSQAAGGGGSEVRLSAPLSAKGSLASGKGVYRERLRNNTLEQRFKVQVEDATPGAQMAISVNGVAFGVVTLTSLGGGEFEFRTVQFIDDPGDGSPIPTDFPRLKAGDTIQVGNLIGAFQP